jgi:hypothetical protein
LDVFWRVAETAGPAAGLFEAVYMVSFPPEGTLGDVSAGKVEVFGGAFLVLV